MSNYFSKDFSNSFTGNAHLYCFLIVVGVTVLLGIVLIDLIVNDKSERIKLGNRGNKGKKGNKGNNQAKENLDDLNHSDNKSNINNHESKNIASEKEKVLSDKISKDQYRKCTLTSIRQYFLINYFIRVYQITMIKTTLACILVITNSDTINPNSLELLLSYIVLTVWIFGMPMFLFLYLRDKQSFLMSPKFSWFFWL